MASAAFSGPPDAIFVIDTKKEHIAVTEANKLGLPGRRGRGHQLRSRRHRLRDPWQRRRDPRRAPDVPHHRGRGSRGALHRVTSRHRRAGWAEGRRLLAARPGTSTSAFSRGRARTGLRRAARVRPRSRRRNERSVSPLARTDAPAEADAEAGTAIAGADAPAEADAEAPAEAATANVDSAENEGSTNG